MSNNRPATSINRLASASSVTPTDLVPQWSNLNATTRKATWQKIINDLNIATIEQINPTILSINENIILTADDLRNTDIILADTSATPLQISLPAISELTSGDTIRIKKSSPSTDILTIMPVGLNTIDGDNVLTMSGDDYPSAAIVTDGIEWFIFNA